MIKKIKSLKNHQGFIKYFKNTSWLMSEKILRMIVGIFVGIWVARYLGPKQFGLLSYAQSFVGLFSILATLGLDVIIVRELVKHEDKHDIILGTAFSLKFFGAFVVPLILYILLSFMSNDNYTNMIILIIAFSIIFQSFTVIDFYFQSRVLSKYIVFSNIISLFISSLLKIILILYSAPLIAFAIVIVFDGFVLALGYIYFYIYNNMSFRKWKFDIFYAKNLLKDSWPLILSGFIFTVYMKIDQVMIKEIMNPQAVGQYAAAVRLSESWYFIPMIISSSVFPAILNAKKENINTYYSRLQKLYDYMVLTAILIAIPVNLLSEWIVEILYGSAYNESASVLTIHIWAGVFVFLGVASGKWFLSENLQVYLMVNTAIGAISNIILNYILIYKMGIIGAAISTLISYALATYFSLILFKKTRGTFMQISKSLLLLRFINVKGKV